MQALRLTPRAFEAQHVAAWRIDVDMDCHLAASEDAFGNITHAFTAEGAVEHFRVLVEGEIETIDMAGVVRGAREPFPVELYLRPTDLTHAGESVGAFASKAIAYGIPGLRVDGNDFLAVWAATQWAAERARANLGATLIEFLTYRASGHSTSDDPTKYRPADEAAHWPLGDPIERLKAHLIQLGEWSEERHAQAGAELTEQLRSAQRAAEEVGTLGQSKPSVAEMFNCVFKEPDWRVIEQRRELGV